MERRTRIGFLVNPLAGIGGPAGLPGSDGLFNVARRRGGYPLSPRSAYRFVARLAEILDEPDMIEVISAPSFMGCNYTKPLSRIGVPVSCMKEALSFPTDREHTVRYTRLFASNSDILVFVGGDGTARDVLDALKDDAVLPVLGVPAGVKIHSGVFASTPENAAYALYEFITGSAALRKMPVVEFVSGRRVFYGELRVPFHSRYLQPAKSPGCIEGVEGIAEYMRELMDRLPGVLFLFGTGSTVHKIMKLLGLEGSVHGVDAVYDGNVIGKGLSEKDIVELIRKYEKTKIVITPIGGQGFILGRGTRALSPRILKLVSRDDLIVVAPECKIIGLNELRVDTGDPLVDARFHGYIRVLIGYREETVRRVV